VWVRDAMQMFCRPILAGNFHVVKYILEERIARAVERPSAIREDYGL